MRGLPVKHRCFRGSVRCINANPIRCLSRSNDSWAAGTEIRKGEVHVPNATTGSSGRTLSGAGLFGACATDQQHGRRRNYDSSRIRCRRSVNRGSLRNGSSRGSTFRYVIHPDRSS